MVAALLLLYFHRVVEYFTPVVVADARSLQPLSLIILESMLDAVHRSCRYWNWGGTWPTQDGVYRFKKRWGTTDFPYRYWTNIYDSSIRSESPEHLLDRYPYFYVYPFSRN